MKTIRAILLAIGLFALTGVVAWAVYETWPFQTPLAIDSNVGDGTPTPIADQWYRVDDFPAGDLIGGGFMLTDAGDARLVNPQGVDLNLFAQDLTSDTATWWLRPTGNLPAGPSTYYLHSGLTGQTRDQVLGLQGTDAVSVADDASLDITTNLTVESVNTTLLTIPSADTYLINKSGAYGLGVRSTNTVFAYIIDGATSTEEILVNAVGDEENIGSETGAGCGAGTHWDCVNETIGADDTNRVITANGVGEERDLYNLAAPAVIISVDEIVSVTVNFRSRTSSVGCGGSCWVKPHIKLGGTVVSGAQQTVTSAWVSYTETLARPGGGSWAFADLASLQAGISQEEGGGNFTDTTQLSITVTYRNRLESSFSPIAVDTEYDLRATYDGANLRLYVDDVQQDIDAAAITLITNASAVAIGPFDGIVTRTRIGDTSVGSPTYRLDLEYEADEVVETQEGNVGNSWTYIGTITDQSASTNDGTYTFVRDMTDFDSIKGALEIKEFNIGEFPQPTPITAVQNPIDTSFDSVNAGGNFPILGPIITAMAGVMSLDANLMWLMVLIILAIITLMTTLIYIKEPLSAMAAAGLVIALGPMIGVFSWFIFIAYIIVATSISVAVIKRA